MTPPLVVPIRTQSEANMREFWAAKAKRTASIRDAVGFSLAAVRNERPRLPVAVTLTRLAPRELDSDNLAGALKAVRDEVAVWLGLPVKKSRGSRPVADDRDPRVTWTVSQRKGEPKQYAVEIRVEAR